jgi:acetaldehyde dehydrogenase/alcohol dehydrogenase
MSIMWYFYSPNIIFGQDSLEFLEKIPGTRCYIVTDPGLVQLKLIDILTKKLKEYGKDFAIFSEVEPDPHETTIIKAAKICRDYHPDLIIGFGGGSSLDVAKSVWAFYENDDDFSVDNLHPFTTLGTGKKAKLCAIPTTSGTGAETTWAVVITRIKEDGTHIKLEQVNKELIPTYAIIDPIFTIGLPPKLTAATGFDALAHVMEGIIASWRNVFSDGLAIEAVDLIRKYLPIAYKDGKNVEAREMMGNAATIAGLSFGNSQVIIGHSLGHVLGANFGITHGNAVGLFIPYVLQYCINDPDNDITKKIISKFAKQVGVADWHDSDDVASKKMVDDIKRLQKEVDLPRKLSDLIKKEEFEAKLDLMADQCLES